MIIKALKTFSDGVISMHEGEIANVPDAKANVFIAEGYAVEYTGEAGEIDLTDYTKFTDVPPIAFNVASAIEGIKTANKYDSVMGTVTDGHYIAFENGNDGALANARYETINVTAGDKYRIKGTYYSHTALYALYNNNTFVSAYPTSKTGIPATEELEVIIPSGVNKIKVGTYGNGATLEISKITPNEGLAVSDNSNILSGKKWTACGDSFTSGDFTGYTDSDGNTGKNSDAYDNEMQMYKSYPWFISRRNNMNLRLLAQGGIDLTNVDGATKPFSVTTSDVNYGAIPADSDYITFQFGLNESDLTTEQIGTKTDSDNTTLWGAYNVILGSVLTNNPTAKIGIILSDAWLSQATEYREAVKDIAKYWGVPCLDLGGDPNVPLLNGGKTYEVSTVAKDARNGAFYVASNNSHPNVKGHEYRSTIIENFLRSL